MKRGRFRRVLSFILAFLIVFSSVNYSGLTSSRVQAEEWDHFTIKPEYSDYSFDYADAMYDEGNSVLLMVRVSPALSDDYTYAFDGHVCNMLYSHF